MTEHKELLARYDRLLHAIDENGRPEELLKMIDYLEEYACMHFKTDERVCGNPAKASSHEEQRQFLHYLGYLRAKAGKEGITESQARLAAREIMHWIVEHVCA